MTSSIPTPNNATIDATGFDATDHTKGRFSHCELKFPHLDLVGVEIVRRGGEVNPKMKIRNSGEYLLALELER